ncbi:hypothetical protein SAMN05216379_1358 [Nitrosomonas eutropha]|uniref:Uncharacterized protein n=1 Tax=Nitrosomonas eutropha TaxID=916 RepID=A0ABX5M7Y5_9PROT|nr:hypothetical protein C8R14_12922 [Nitrosomonas eutropha]SCX26945.1 hypothetical protein SAMN05216379_1358 [Nitrosomonas eutropha]
MICIHPFDQAANLRAISSGTLCNKDSERHTMRIHGQMYLGVELPFSPDSSPDYLPMPLLYLVNAPQVVTIPYLKYHACNGMASYEILLKDKRISYL